MESSALIVVTDGYLRRVIAGQFEQAEFEILTADSGGDALEIVQNKAIDVLMLDHNIDDMVAADVIRRVQNHHNGKNTHIVLVSGDHDARQTPEGQLADFVLLKPITIAELTSLARQLTTAAAKTIPYGDKLRAMLHERLHGLPKPK